jgi:hypothetical protein
MMHRWPTSATSTIVVDRRQRSWAWVQTTGGASPTIVASYGVSSITDQGVGLMDVTLQAGLGSAQGTALVTVNSIHSTGSRWVKVSHTTIPTATVFRIGTCDVNGAATDASNGHNVLVAGL